MEQKRKKFEPKLQHLFEEWHKNHKKSERDEKDASGKGILGKPSDSNEPDFRLYNWKTSTVTGVILAIIAVFFMISVVFFIVSTVFLYKEQVSLKSRKSALQKVYGGMNDVSRKATTSLQGNFKENPQSGEGSSQPLFESKLSGQEPVKSNSGNNVQNAKKENQTDDANIRSNQIVPKLKNKDCLVI